MKIFAIESSCDETAAAIVEDGTKVISQSLASSGDIHQKSGGVIPEIAARKQVEYINAVVADCINKAKFPLSDIDAVAVTYGPGLIGSLIVGVEAAKALALAIGKPIVPVNHLVGHIYGNYIDKNPSDIKLPAIVLLVSGGHTDLVLMKNHGDFTYIGGTLDDAVGEAFDKTARSLGLSPYLGGPHIAKAAKVWKSKILNEGASSSFAFKRPMIDSKDFNFSFSGIKTAVITKIKSYKENNLDIPTEEIAYEFEEAVTDVLIIKTLAAVKKYNVKTVLVAGGVSANTALREKLEKECSKEDITLFVPPLYLCNDNAIYIASCAYFNYHPKSFDQVLTDPSLTIMSS